MVSRYLGAAAVALAWAVSSDAAVLKEDTRLSFEAVLPEGAGVTLSLGRGQEKLSVSSKDNAYPWRYTGVNGEDPQRRAYPGSSRPEEKMTYWWERTQYTPNGRLKPSFSLPSAVSAMSDFLQAERWQTAATRKLRFAVELSNGLLLYYLDDILLHALPATADAAGCELKVVPSKGAALTDVRTSAVDAEPGAYRVPLGNVATDGVVDVSRSWVRETCVNEDGAPNSGTFGGRWAGALSATPCRLQFRVPNRRYEAMYLLASCTNRNFLTVQFYRPGSGFPVDCVPTEPIPTDGKPHLVRISLRQDQLAAFADREILEFELTGRTHDYSAWPEPSHYSRHGGGEPSGVRVHAITLKESALEIDFDPEAFGNVWTGLSPKPAYRLVLRNRAAADVSASVSLTTTSWYGTDRTAQERTIHVPAKGEVACRLETPVRAFGWYAVELTVNGEKYERSLVVLRPRSYKARPFDAKGFMFGCWKPGTVHFAPPVYDACRLAFPLGIESFSFGHLCSEAEIEPLAKKYGVRDFLMGNYRHPPWSPEMIENGLPPRSAVNDSSYAILFAEPGGIGLRASLAALCGADVPPDTPEQQARYLSFKTNIMAFAELFRAKYPGKKILMPWGSPLFTAAYLQDPETRNAFDGMSFDTAFFDRLPEGQVHCCSLYTLTLMNREWRKYRSDAPLITSVEGPCVSGTRPGALPKDVQMRNILRANLILSANGSTRLFAGMAAGVESASYWGEQHYDGGAFSCITLNPHPSYAACGTMIRMLRDCEFVRVVPTGSLGVFALEYRTVGKGQPLHVMWTVRGRVPFKVKGGVLTDAMDNPKPVRELTPEPVFLQGAQGEIAFGRQVFDKDDVTPAADAVKLGTLAGWAQSAAEPDEEYLQNMPDSIRRYPVRMDVASEGNRLSIALPANLPDRDAMPFVTTLVPPKPIALPGRPHVLALETTAASDWGRVVYVLRDAKGEKFISVGQRDTYNVDDTRCDSFFNFTGTRLVRMELPGCRPWDSMRFPGSCWWGAYGGDGLVDYPLSVEKVFVERRTKAMHVNDLVATDPAPVVFGALYAEGIDPDSDLRMTPPPAGAKRVNPIAEIAGALPPTEITGVRQPDHYYDGTRGHFDFREMPEAVSYDIYVSLDPSGEGAILLKKGAKRSGELVNGFLPNTEHFGFIVWRNKKGELSKPSAPFKFRQKNEFAER